MLNPGGLSKIWDLMQWRSKSQTNENKLKIPMNASYDTTLWTFVHNTWNWMQKYGMKFSISEWFLEKNIPFLRAAVYVVYLFPIQTRRTTLHHSIFVRASSKCIFISSEITNGSHSNITHNLTRVAPLEVRSASGV